MAGGGRVYVPVLSCGDGRGGAGGGGDVDAVHHLRRLLALSRLRHRPLRRAGAHRVAQPAGPPRRSPRPRIRCRGRPSAAAARAGCGVLGLWRGALAVGPTHRAFGLRGPRLRPRHRRAECGARGVPAARFGRVRGIGPVVHSKRRAALRRLCDGRARGGRWLADLRRHAWPHPQPAARAAVCGACRRGPSWERRGRERAERDAPRGWRGVSTRRVGVGDWACGAVWSTSAAARDALRRQSAPQKKLLHDSPSDCAPLETMDSPSGHLVSP
mmetsp:Transcript_12303/g.31457  ORF Transcript_12303/g.31457 Transcript_12303/m.31457 type:complete len:271 (+) Transcript_12303:127-939(+)